MKAKQAKPIPQMNLPSVKDLMQSTGTKAGSGRVLTVTIDRLHAFKDHPYYVDPDDPETLKILGSIREYGIITPILARERDEGDGYEIISGHRRLLCCELAGLGEVPVIVRDISHNDAIKLMLDANVQREGKKISELGRVLKMELAEMNRQGRRVEENSDSSRSALAKKYGISPAQIQRFVRITELIRPLSLMVDTKKIALYAGAEISHIHKELQELLYKQIELLNISPSIKQAAALREYAGTGRLDEKSIAGILEENEFAPEAVISIRKNELARYFPPDTKPKEIRRVIIELLEERFAPK